MVWTIVSELVGHMWFPVFAPQVYRPCATSFFFFPPFLSIYISPFCSTYDLTPRATASLILFQKHHWTSRYSNSFARLPIRFYNCRHPPWNNCHYDYHFKIKLVKLLLRVREFQLSNLSREIAYSNLFCFNLSNSRLGALYGSLILDMLLTSVQCTIVNAFNPLNAELNPICHLLTLLGVHFLHVSRIRVKSLTLRLLMSYIYIYIYIYGAPILDVSRSHTTTQHSR